MVDKSWKCNGYYNSVFAPDYSDCLYVVYVSNVQNVSLIKMDSLNLNMEQHFNV